MIEQLLAQLRRHEGLRLRRYKCSAGHWTIGYGHLIQSGESFAEITESQAENLLLQDAQRAVIDCDLAFDFWCELNEARKVALANMMFNLGPNRLAKFSRMLAALDAHEYGRAAAEALNSKWASQVGSRATELAEIIRTGHL